MFDKPEKGEKTQKEHRHGAPIFGIFVLFVGVVLFLQTIGTLPWSLWGGLWRFWPVLIIIVGLDIVLGKQLPWLVGILAASLLAFCVWIAAGQTLPPVQMMTKAFQEPILNTQQAQVVLHIDAGTINVKGLPAGSGQLARGTYEVRDGSEAVKISVSNAGSQTLLRINSNPDKSVNWSAIGSTTNIDLTPEVPLTIDVNSAASRVFMDLGQLKVILLKMNLTAGDYKIIMPSNGTMMASIKAEVSNIEITVPSGVAARINAKQDVNILKVDERRFPSSGGYFVSPDYDRSQNRVDLDIQYTVGRVVVQ